MHIDVYHFQIWKNIFTNKDNRLFLSIRIETTKRFETSERDELETHVLA